MALASLTIDLTVGLARFEGDVSRITQIATRESERLERARQSLLKQLEREAETAGRSRGEVLALKAAYLGLTEQASKYIEKIAEGERRTATVAGGDAITQAASREIAANAQRSNSQRELVQSINAVAVAYQKQQRDLIQSLASGQITPDSFKAQIAAAQESAKAAVQDIRTKAAQQQAARELAEQERVAAEQRRAAAQKIIDSQNGLSATYRSQLAALRELRDSGALSPEQFRTAGSELVSRQPGVQARQRAAEEVRNAERQISEQSRLTAEAQVQAARRVVDAQNGLTATYRQQLQALRDLRDAGAISPQQFRQAGIELVSRQPVSQERRKQDDEAAAAAEAARRQAEQLAEADRQAGEVRRLSAQKLIDAQNGLTATYRQQLQAIRELREAGLITPQQARQAGTELVNKQPAVQQRQREAEEAKAAAELIAKQAQESAAAEVAAAAKRKAALEDLSASLAGFTQNYRRSLAVLEESFRAGDISFERFQQLKGQLNEQQNPLVVQYRQQQEAAKRAADEVAAAAKRKADSEQEAASRFVQSLQQQADAIGKTRTQLLLEEAARRGVADQVRPYIERIESAEKSLNKFGRTSGVARYQLQTLQYTVSDVVASLASGIPPITILLQQGGQVLDVFGSVGNVFRTVASLITPFRVAVGGAVTVLGGLVYALYQGAEQSKQFADTVTLTGNFAGLTEGRFNSLTRTVAASGQVLVSAAREYGLALAATGQISQKNFDAATEAAARFGAATGQSAKDVAQQFASLGEDVTAGATKLNQTYNFLSAAQFRQIREFQEQGRTTDALAVVYDALNQRLRALEPNLGLLDRTLRTVKGAWADFWDAAFDIGRAETIEQKIDKARQAAERARNVGTERVSQTQLDPERRARLPADRATTVENADEQVRLLQRSKAAQEAAAAAIAEAAADQKRAVSADAFVQGYLKKAKSVESLNKALDEAKRKFADLDKVGQPVPASQQKEILDQIREDFTDKGKLRDALKLQKAERDAAIKFITDELKTERDAYSFQNQYLQGIYQQGLVSLKTYFAAKRDATERDTQAQLNAIDAQIGVQQRFLQEAKGKDPAAAVEAQKNIDSLNEQAKQIVAERQRAVVLANIEEAGSYKQLGDRVVEYRAQLLQLQGDEYGAAQLRAAQAIEAARILSRQSAGRPGAISDDEIRRQEQALDVANKLAEVQRRNSLQSAEASRLEEFFTLRAVQSGQELRDTETGIYLLRQRSLEQLGELARQAAELAAVSTDPRVQQFAADLALQYAKAAENVNPTINRLREGANSLGDSLGDAFGRAVKEATKLRDLAKQVVDQVKSSVVDFLITDPLKQSFKGLLRGGINGGLLQPFGGTSSDPSARNYENSFDLASTAAETLKTGALSSQAATSLQTTAITQSTSAMVSLTTAANAAATALASISGNSIGDGLASGFSSVFAGNDFIENPFAAVALADGTNYVPYDGMKATLHKGEAVVPSKYNPAAGGQSAGGGRTNIQIYNSAGAQVRAEEGPGGDLKIFVEAAVNEMERRMASGGSTDRVMRATYGVGRNLARRG